MEIDEKLLPQYNSAVRDELQNYLNELAPISPLAGGSSGRGAGSDPETYLKPIETRDDFIASGLINEDGSPTDSGKRFDDLGMAGVIDANGLLTDKGRAYKLSDDELVREENIDAYKIADSDGLFKKKDQPLSTYVSNALGGVYDAVKGAFELIPTVSPVYNAYVMATGSEEEIEKKLNEDKVKIDSFVQDATKSVMNSSLLALKAAGVLSKESDKYINVLDKYIPDSLKTPEMVELANQRNKELDERYWKTKQRNQALTNIVEGYNNSKLANDLEITTDLVLQAEYAKSSLPQERVQEIQKNVGSFASLVVDPLDLIPFGKAFSAGKVAETAYSGQRAAGKLAEEMARKSNAELAIANYEPIALASQDAADLAFRKADGFSSVGNIERADTIRAFGEKMRGRAESLKPLLDQAAIDIQKSTRNIDRLSQFTDAPAILETMADAGRKSASVIADRVGRATNAIGSGLEKIDSGISGFISDTGVDQARKALSVIGLAKTGALFSGVPALQVAAGVVSSGPILKAVGNFSRVMGQEALEKIGSVPFWQRVAANETVGPMGKALSHFFDSATTAGMFGGRAATDAIKGTAQLVPIMTAIGVAENDGNLDANVLKGAIGQSVAFGGVGRAMGGMMIGSKRDIRVNQLGDELNFRKRIEDPVQLSRFINLPAGIRRSIGTYSAAFPELKWDFRTEGGSKYTDNGVSSSVAININSTNPLKALVAHEVNHALLIKNGMEEAVASLLVGDGIQNGGIIRALDGTLDPSFEKFKAEYHARMERQARSNNQIYNPIDDRKMAVEYFVDSKADRMLEMAQSGQLGRIAGKSKMNAVLDSVISSIPIIKDLHMKMGGTYEANGKMVDGTGLATLIETPQGKKLFNDMLHDSAGWRRSNKLSKYNSEPSSTIFLDENDPMHKLLVSDYETDVNGVMILDKNRKPIPISRDTDQRREAGGFKIDEIQRNRVAAGETLADGELRYNPSTKSWDGYFLSNAAIAQLEATNVFNRKQIEMLRSLNRTAQKGDGSRFQVLYNPATSRGRGGKVRYATRGIKLAEVVPVGVKVGAKGQILIEVMDTHQLAENVKQMASKSKAQNLNHTIQTIMNDAQAIMDAHGKNKPSDPYFKDKYGEKWEDYKGFANAVFGKLSSAQAEKNPTLNKVKPSRPVFKTYRLDRTNKVTSMSGDQMPFNYSKIVANYLPEGNPLLDKNGEVINIRDEQQKALDNAGKEQIRYMPEGKPKSKSNDNLKLLKTKKTLRDWAVTQESWKDWYSEHQETLDEFFGDYAGLFQEILAVTSQASSVKANVGLALKAFGQLMRNEEFDAKLRGLEKSGYLPAVIKNLNAIKNNTEVGGRKISNYKKANEGDSSRVVVDRHIARMLFGVDTPSAKQYAKAEKVLSDVAKQLGWKPAQVQAALWAQSIVMSGKDPVSYGAYLKDLESRKLTKKDLINGIKGNQLTKRIGEISGRSYGSDANGKERGRYSPSGKAIDEGKSGVTTDTRYMPEGSKSHMDKMLANPPEVPKDLQEAWDIGHRTQELSDTEAVYSGQVPDWVFNSGNDVNQFYEAGRKGEDPEYIVGWRRGKIPESGRSKNYADNSMESGVSLAYAHNRDDMETSPMTMIGVSDRKKTYVSGWAFPKSQWGSDGEIVVLAAKEFNPTSSDSRYMPEPIPKDYKSSRDETYLRASLGPDGTLDLKRPIRSNEALPTIGMRHDYPTEDFKVFKFDKRASVVYAKNKNGVEISFKFDPALMNAPEFKDFDTKYDGVTVQLAMADRHGATDGDMGGHSFPDLKVNQENIVDDGNGNKYKLVWSNNAWGPVANMSSKAQKYEAFTLLTYNMDRYAHDSNTRTVRIFSNEIANSGLSIKDQNTILIVQNVALKKSLTSASKSDLRQLIKSQNDLKKKLDIDDKILAGSKRYSGVEKLSQTDRDSLIDSINNGEEMIKEEEKFLAESLGAKDASAEELKIDKLFREYQTKRRAYDKTPNSEKKKEAMLNAEKAIRTFQKTKEFKVAEGLLPSRELDTFSSTFKGRKALIKAVKAGDSSAKWGSFDAEAISQKIGDQLTGDNMHIVGSVELSRDPNFKAVYLGEDPKEIARMSEAEKAAAIKFKSNPDFVAHEAYLWSMLGPAESKHYFNTNQRSVLDSFPDFVTEYSELPVKEGKKKLNDPESKASEFNIVNTIRDQSKIPIVFKKWSTTRK